MTKAEYTETEAEAKAEAVDPKTEVEVARQYVNKSHMCAVSLTRKANKHFLTQA